MAPVGFFYFILFLTFLATVKGLSITTVSPDDDQWTDRYENEETKYLLKWSLDDPNWLVMEMSAPAKGYVAVGFSPDEKMNGSDIVMGWVDTEGKAHIKDLYGVGNTKPKEDTKQNVELLSGEEKEGQTVIRFRRPWNSCEGEHDRPINLAHRVIWAYNQEDPKLADDDGVFRPPYHFKTREATPETVKVDVPAGYTCDCNKDNDVPTKRP